MKFLIFLFIIKLYARTNIFNKRFIDLNHSKDNSMGVKFQTEEMERTKHYCLYIDLNRRRL